MKIPYSEVQNVLLLWERGESKPLPESLRDLLHKYDKKRLVSVAEFAILAGNVHKETVRCWIRDERIKASNIKPNSKRATYRIQVSELQKVLRKKDTLPG